MLMVDGGDSVYGEQSRESEADHAQLSQVLDGQQGWRHRLQAEDRVSKHLGGCIKPKSFRCEEAARNLWPTFQAAGSIIRENSVSGLRPMRFHHR